MRCKTLTPFGKTFHPPAIRSLFRTPRSAFSSGCVFLKKGGRRVMKKFLLAFYLCLLFTTDATALSCSGLAKYVAYDSEYGESCESCPTGCLSCNGNTLYWTRRTNSRWDTEKYMWVDDPKYVQSSTPSCDSCLNNYKLKRGTTSSFDGTASSSVSFYRCERETITCPSNCSSCPSSSICTACKSGYTLKNGSCVKPCPANCAECNSSGTCTKCNSGYKLKDGTCKVGSVISCPDDMKLSADGCCCIAG